MKVIPNYGYERGYLFLVYLFSENAFRFECSFFLTLKSYMYFVGIDVEDVYRFLGFRHEHAYLKYWKLITNRTE
jgi:hypothetical protein